MDPAADLAGFVSGFPDATKKISFFTFLFIRIPALFEGSLTSIFKD
jgi:hypothetical protein